MSGTNWQCCCGDVQCPDSCSFNRSYTLVNHQWILQYTKALLTGVGQACCFDIMSWDFNATAVPASPIILRRYPLGTTPTPPCCYYARFDMNISGTFSLDWDFYMQNVLCEKDQDFNFNEDVPCEYRITCSGNNLWKHEIKVCHFQIACSAEYNLGDCEGCQQDPNNPCCVYGPNGLRCAGGVLTWYTPLNALSSLTPAMISNVSWCSGGELNCQPYEPGLETAYGDYEQWLASNGAKQAFGIYLTDECSEGDPFLPCDSAYDMTAAGAIMFGSAPSSFAGAWCGGTLQNYQVGCSDWNRNFLVTNWGTYV